MRYLLDTNILVYAIMDQNMLDCDVKAILEDYDNQFYMSAESVRELIVAYRNKGLGAKTWKSVEAMLNEIEEEYNVQILPLKREHMLTYARMITDEAQGHKDPSDHVIIAHAITEKIPLISSDTRFQFYCAQGLDLVFNRK